MKTTLKLFITLFLCFPLILHAQEKEENYHQKVSKLFEHIDLEKRVEKGLLYEFASPLMDITAIPEDQVISPIQWRIAYGVLMSAQVNESVKIRDLRDINKETDQLRTEGITPLLFMDYSLNRLRPDALEKNLLLLQNGQFFDVSGENESLFEETEVFLAAPSDTYTRTGQAKFLLTKSLFLSNKEGTPEQVEADFGDGKGWQTLKWETPLARASSLVPMIKSASAGKSGKSQQMLAV